MAEVRKLVAILASDVVGYSRLARADEDRILARDGIVYLGMKRSCSGRPSSTATLEHGIENPFKHFLPEVKAV